MDEVGIVIKGHCYTSPSDLPPCEGVVKRHHLLYDPGGGPLQNQTDLHCDLTPVTSSMVIKHVHGVDPEGVGVACMGSVLPRSCIDLTTEMIGISRP